MLLSTMVASRQPLGRKESLIEIVARRLVTIIIHIPKGLRAESARAVTGRRCPHSGKGENFFYRSAGFFYGSSCNFGTESRKIVSKVGN